MLNIWISYFCCNMYNVPLRRYVESLFIRHMTRSRFPSLYQGTLRLSHMIFPDLRDFHVKLHLNRQAFPMTNSPQSSPTLRSCTPDPKTQDSQPPYCITSLNARRHLFGQLCSRVGRQSRTFRWISPVTLWG
jgi:hypothetical protein